MDVSRESVADHGLGSDILESVRTLALKLVTLAIVLVAWELAGQFEVYHNFLPPLSEVLEQFYELTVSGVMLDNAYLTLRRAFIGLLVACALGVPIGVLSARNRLAGWFWDPIIEVGYPVPVIALVPVFVFWFGTGDLSKIALVTVGCFWPIAINARNSTREVDENLVWSAKMMGTSDRAVLWKVVVPSATPGILTGIQIALPISLIITFVFEMVAGGGGLGHLEIQAHRSFRTDQMYATIIAVMLIGFVLDRGLGLLRDRLLRWT